MEKQNAYEHYIWIALLLSRLLESWTFCDVESVRILIFTHLGSLSYPISPSLLAELGPRYSPRTSDTVATLM